MTSFRSIIPSCPLSRLLRAVSAWHLPIGTNRFHASDVLFLFFTIILCIKETVNNTKGGCRNLWTFLIWHPFTGGQLQQFYFRIDRIQNPFNPRKALGVGGDHHIHPDMPDLPSAMLPPKEMTTRIGIVHSLLMVITLNQCLWIIIRIIFLEKIFSAWNAFFHSWNAFLVGNLHSFPLFARSQKPNPPKFRFDRSPSFVYHIG